MVTPKQSKVDEAIERINTHYSEVKGIIICDSTGTSVRSTMTQELTQKFSKSISELAERARSMIRELDHTNDLLFLRIRSSKIEIMMAPDEDYYLIVVQDLES